MYDIYVHNKEAYDYLIVSISIGVTTSSILSMKSLRSNKWENEIEYVEAVLCQPPVFILACDIETFREKIHVLLQIKKTLNKALLKSMGRLSRNWFLHVLFHS